MENAKVYSDAIARLTTLFKDTFGSYFVSYYEGDPVSIPSVSLPAIIIEKQTGRLSITDAPTGHDRFTEVISIRLVLNKEDDLGASDEKDLTERKLRRLVEARDPSTGQYMQGTLLKALRTHLTLDDLQFNADIEIAYDINPRPDQLVTSEAQVIISNTGIIPIDGRN